jgi:hypothetical protein
MNGPITRPTPPEGTMSSLLPLPGRNRASAATGASAGPAVQQLPGQRPARSGEGRRARLRLEVAP